MTRCRLLTSLSAAILSCVPRVTTAQQLSGLDRSRAQTMLDMTRDAIASRYYDSTFHGIDLAARHDTAAARIRAATDFNTAFAAIAQFTLELHDSHTFFDPPRRTISVEYGWDMAPIGDTCYVVSVTRGSDAEKQGVHRGDAVLSLNGYPPTRSNEWQLLYLFRLLRPQRSLHVTLRAPGGTPRDLDLAAVIHERPRILDLTGSDGGTDITRIIRDAEKTAEEMRGELVEIGDSILVWRFPAFMSLDNVDDAVDHARNKQALIIDLRGNSGGAESALERLVERIYADSVTIGTLHERTTVEPLVVKGGGKKAFAGRLLVLVDSHSASAAEVAARVVQLTKRGRVIGDRTEGAVMRSRYNQFSLGTQTAIIYGVSVTDADLVMTDGGRLEGVGVTPDELLLPTPNDLAANRDPVLARALTLAGRPISASDAGTLVYLRKP